MHGDSPAPNSIWQRRSTDGGRTWGEPAVVRAGDESTVPGERTGYSDPSYVVDIETGAIFLFCVFSKDVGMWDSRFGHDDVDRRIASASLSVSRDAGRTWEHRSLTEVVKPAACRATFATSGAGIQLRYGPHRGRLVQQYAGWFECDDGGEVVSAYSVYSDDHGETWRRGTPVGTEMDENTVCELSDGTLLMNFARARAHRSPLTRHEPRRRRDLGAPTGLRPRRLPVLGDHPDRPRRVPAGLRGRGRDAHDRAGGPGLDPGSLTGPDQAPTTNRGGAVPGSPAVLAHRPVISAPRASPGSGSRW